MPGVDHPVELQNLSLQYPQLDTESRQTHTGNLGQPLVICVRDDAKQLLDTVAADRCNDAKLREMSPDGMLSPTGASLRCLLASPDQAVQLPA